MKPADYSLLAIGAIAATHNIVAAGRGKQLISERVDDYLVAHPLLTRAAIGLLALHLANSPPLPAAPQTPEGRALVVVQPPMYPGSPGGIVSAVTMYFSTGV